MTQRDESDFELTREDLEAIRGPGHCFEPKYGLRQILFDMNGNILVDRVVPFDGVLTHIDLPVAYDQEYALGALFLTPGSKVRLELECIEPAVDES